MFVLHNHLPHLPCLLFPSENKFVSVKALKGYATEIVNRGISRELTVLQLLSTAQAPTAWPSRCLSLLDHFIMPGKVSTDGEHLCIITDLMGGDVKSLVRGLPRGKRYVPLPLAKRILRHVLEGLVQIHSLGVAHTDLKHDNIMFDVDPSLDIPSLLTRDPPRLNIPGKAPFKPQFRSRYRLPILWMTSLREISLLLTLGAVRTLYLHVGPFFNALMVAQIVEPDDRTTDDITPCALRAPETILLGPWNQRVDMWTFGCLVRPYLFRSLCQAINLAFPQVFELITGQNLFEYVPYPDRGLDAAAGHLWQMICFTGEEFEPKQLRWSQRAIQYFERTTCGFCHVPSEENVLYILDLHPGYLKENPPRIIYPFETPLRKYKAISEEDVLVTATFMRRCLRLDPNDRPSAEQLLDDPFWAERGV